MSVTPVHSEPPNILLQVSPPLFVLYKPLSPPLDHSGP